jgi:hypothetical protein
LQRLQRRRGDAARGGLPSPQLMPRTVEMPDVTYGGNEFSFDSLDSVNPWLEPDSYFYYDHGIDAAHDTDVFIHLEL